MTLYPWRVHDGDEDYSWRWLVWAPDQQAAQQACKPFCDCSPEELTVEPEPSLSPQEGERAYVEGSTYLLRSLGGRCDGDSSCDACGLYECDGAYPVCEGCWCCSECGHDEGCELGGTEQEEVTE